MWTRKELINGTIAFLLGGVLVTFGGVIFSDRLQRSINVEQRRIENARFVRDAAMNENQSVMAFRNLDLEGMNLNGLRLPCRDKQSVEACFLKADFTGANLANADLSLMDLSGADFTGANLSGANLRGSRLDGVIFVQADLEDADLDDACWTATTIWPESVDLPRPDTDGDGGQGEVCNPGL
jgi:uncharacterized protein YjbI with pentapeptide repeats